MRFGTFTVDGRTQRLGALVGDRVMDIEALSRTAAHGPLPSSMVDFLLDPEINQQRAAKLLVEADRSSGYAVSDVVLHAPIPRPRQNVIAVGANYRDHIAEATRAQNRSTFAPDHPAFFTKRATSVTGPGATIEFDPGVTPGLDWEAELAVIIGRGGKDISPATAYEHVFGYTCANDVTARDVQHKRHGGQWFKGKSLDGACPLGPWIVSRDEIPDPHALRIGLRVNGVTKQEASTGQMIFDIPTIIAELSAGLTLEAGDVILTGTPSGVGYARTPPELLGSGDVVEVEIERIGILRNTVREARSARATSPKP